MSVCERLRTAAAEKAAGEFCPLCERTGVFAFYKDGVPCRICDDGHPPVFLAWAWESAEEYEAQYLDTDYHGPACRAQGLPAQPSGPCLLPGGQPPRDFLVRSEPLQIFRRERAALPFE